MEANHTSTAQTKPDNTPSSPEAKAVACLYGRGTDTEWSDAEIALFRAAVKRKAITIESLARMEKYYNHERKKGPDGIHRRDLTTWLRHVDGENDRAVAFSTRKTGNAMSFAPVGPRVVVPMTAPELTDEERQAYEAVMNRKQKESA